MPLRFSRPPFRSASAAVIALACTALVFSAALSAEPVQAGEVFYRAELGEPAGTDRAVVGGIAWYCKDRVCVAAKGKSRPLRICRSLSRELGTITSFTARGEALDEAALAACNGN